MPEAATVHCPYCGERFDTLVDPTAGDAEYVEDCPVCCRPIVLSLDLDGVRFTLHAAREDD